MIHLDTHVVAWLYLGDLSLFPDAVKEQLNESRLGISPMVTLELQYLHEVGRLSVGGAEIVGELASTIGLDVDEVPLGELVAAALPVEWTRDPFDRTIVAHANLRRARLATKDRAIRERYERAFWG